VASEKVEGIVDSENEEKLFLLEVKTLTEETIRRSQALLNDDYKPRRHFAIAQVAACRDLMKYLLDEEDWTDAGSVLEATLEGEEERYLKAYDAEDRTEMLIALANRRILKRLIRRLTDPRRRQSLMPTLATPSDTTGADTLAP
jgi:hypothetical protein